MRLKVLEIQKWLTVIWFKINETSKVTIQDPVNVSTLLSSDFIGVDLKLFFYTLTTTVIDPIG